MEIKILADTISVTPLLSFKIFRQLSIDTENIVRRGYAVAPAYDVDSLFCHNDLQVYGFGQWGDVCLR